MSDIQIKSPALADRDQNTVRIHGKISFGTGTGCTCASASDIPGITVTAACDDFIISGLEDALGMALDTDRSAAVIVTSHLNATLVGISAAEWKAGVTTTVISGTAGSRILTATVASMAAGTDSVVDGDVELILPVKLADF